MNYYLLIIFLLFATGTTLLVVANMFFYTLLGEVNGTLPQDQHISMIFVNARYGRILRLHCELFPQSGKRKRMKLVGMAGLLFMLAGFVLDIAHFGHW